MENASKALIIAGAILLSILLISLGIMIFTQAQETVNNTDMSATEIQVFNSKITKYEGTKVSGSTVKGLINEVIALNADSDPETPVIKIKMDGASKSGSKITTSLVNNKSTYTVAITKYTSGYVSNITITTNN